jgi:hypothetical protein
LSVSDFKGLQALVSVHVLLGRCGFNLPFVSKNNHDQKEAAWATLKAIGDVLGFLILRTCETSTVKGPERSDNAGLGADPEDVLRKPSSTGSISTDMMAAGLARSRSKLCLAGVGIEIAIDGALCRHEGAERKGMSQLDARRPDRWALGVGNAKAKVRGGCV